MPQGAEQSTAQHSTRRPCPRARGGSRVAAVEALELTRNMEERAMDRRQHLVQRAREFFGDRLDDVLHNVQQDRQELRGWQEPAHVRAAVRRAIREEGGGAQMTQVTLTEDTVTDVTQVF